METKWNSSEVSLDSGFFRRAVIKPYLFFFHFSCHTPIIAYDASADGVLFEKPTFIKTEVLDTRAFHPRMSDESRDSMHAKNVTR